MRFHAENGIVGNEGHRSEDRHREHSESIAHGGADLLAGSILETVSSQSSQTRMDNIVPSGLLAENKYSTHHIHED